MTRIDPKISTVDPNAAKKDEQIQDDAASSSSTKFITVDNKDPWKALTESSSDIALLSDAMQAANNNSGGSRKDAIMNSLFICDPIEDRKWQVDHSLPHIPDLHEEIFKPNPRLQDNVEPIVERFEALKLTLEELRKNTLDALKKPLNANEIQSNQRYIDDLNKALLKLEKQLEEANYYWHLQKLRDKAAREAEET